MFKKIKIIVKAWIAAANPTTEDEKRALYRLSVCYYCKHKKRKLFVQYCELCWCPLNKKVYAENKNSCDLRKWEF